MKNQFIITLGIETSCDETAAAVARGSGDKVEILSNAVSSQIEIHKKYGGVVPEVAAREHVLNILAVVNEALEKANLTPLNPPLPGGKIKSPLIPPEGKSTPLLKGVKAIAVTVGPGLVTSLLVGVETAKTLAYAWGVPVAAVNHIEGHIYANFITPSNPPLQGGRQGKIKFPAIILTVSGGHTMLILMTGHGKYKVLGETRDDAAGEAFDKAAQLLGLGYPGGPIISQLATRNSQLNKKNSCELRDMSCEISLPRPMINSGDYNFSFSGLKTALFYQLQRDKDWRKKISAYAAEFQRAAVEVLVAKTIKAARSHNARTIMLSGGVAANLELRNQLARAVKNNLIGAKLIIPEFKYCTDNAAMIAAAGYFRARRKSFTPWQKLRTEPNKEFK